MKYKMVWIEFDTVYGMVGFHTIIPNNKKGDCVSELNIKNDINIIEKEVDKLEKFIKPTNDKIRKLNTKQRELEAMLSEKKLCEKFKGKFFKYTNKKTKFYQYFKILSIDVEDYWNEIKVLKIEWEEGLPELSIICKANIDKTYKEITKEEFDEKLKEVKKVLK